MNKKKFLAELSKGLNSLSKSEIDDILYFYDERITNGTRSGKTEDEVIGELEPINVIVENTLSELGIEPTEVKKAIINNEIVAKKVQPDKQPNVSKSTDKISKYVKLGLFDILLASWLVVGSILAFLFSLAIPLTLSFVAVTSFLTTYDIVIQISLFIGTASVVLLSIILVNTTWLIAKYIIQFVLNINYNSINQTDGKKYEFKFNVRKTAKDTDSGQFSHCSY